MGEQGFELSLSGPNLPPGEIGLGDLAAITEALQGLMTRIGREAVDRAGPGRSTATVEALTALRLTSLSAGSTRLGISVGDERALPIGPLNLQREIDTRFWEVIAAIEEGTRPPGTSDLVADTAMKLIDAFRRSAATVEVSSPGGRRVMIDTRKAQRQPWLGPTEVEGEATLTIAGVLEMVDLKSARFRIRDDVGNGIRLEAVAEPHEVGPLIGRRVRASGHVVRDRAGSLHALRGVAIALFEPPPEWTPTRPPDLAAILKAAPGPEAAPAIDLSDDEFDEFMVAIRG